MFDNQGGGRLEFHDEFLTLSQGVGLNDQRLGTKKLPPFIVALGPRGDKKTIHKVFKTIFDSAQSTFRFWAPG